MFTKLTRLAIDDILALTGFACLVSGVFLWLGLPAALILTGVTLIYTGAKIETRKSNEPDQATYPNG